MFATLVSSIPPPYLFLGSYFPTRPLQLLSIVQCSVSSVQCPVIVLPSIPFDSLGLFFLSYFLLFQRQNRNERNQREFIPGLGSRGSFVGILGFFHANLKKLVQSNQLAISNPNENFDSLVCYLPPLASGPLHPLCKVISSTG